ncbi:MAG: hypothetical protein WCX30_01530 [Candidatus Paceibacterota bacterium]
MKKNIVIIVICVVIAVIVLVGFLGGNNGGSNNNTEINKQSESVSLIDITTTQGISLKIPKEMTLLENGAYANMETGDAVSFGVTEVGGIPLSDWKEADVLATYQSKYKDVVVKSFENGKKIDGKEALVSKVAVTTPDSHPVILVLIMITDGSKNYVINFVHGASDTDGVLVKNLQQCIDSIKIKSV